MVVVVGQLRKGEFESEIDHRWKKAGTQVVYIRSTLGHRHPTKEIAASLRRMKELGLVPTVPTP